MKTMIYYFTIVTCFTICNSFGQSLDKLDAKYGFNIFKFGTNPDNYKGKIYKGGPGSFQDNVITYYYDAKESDVLVDVAISKMLLEFYKDKLMSIQVYFDDSFSDNDYNTILNFLQTQYGDGIKEDYKPAGTSYQRARKWVGKKVELSIYYYYDHSWKKWFSSMSISEISLRNQCYDKK